MTPVVLILFNRPDVTARVFASIRAARPSQLLLIADGPRNDAERALTDAARAAADVDWSCDVHRRYADANLGCRANVWQGLDWVFDRCDEAVILEDDCLPDPTFFPYCTELLARYRDDPRVAMISGDNFQSAPPRDDGHGYYFSAIAHVWGWATWRRAWRRWFDVSMKTWPADRESAWLRDLLIEDEVRATYRRAFDAVHEGKVDTWDAQWQLAVWRSRGLVALPSVNLVSNLGFGESATHTKKADSPDANLPTAAMQFPLRHPPEIRRDAAADLATWRRSLARKTIA
jgi:hypothetical protein